MALKIILLHEISETKKTTKQTLQTAQFHLYRTPEKL